LTRVAVISDTHVARGTRTLPARCAELCRAADLLLHCGDVTAVRFWEELQRLGRPLEGVHGNMDEPALRDLLPDTRVVEVADARIGMVHIPGPAAGREQRLVSRFPGCAAVIYGHTHVPQVERHGDVWILNPGSPTERRRGPVHAMLLLEVRKSTILPELVEL
jgi:putative phosphoesterase